VVSGKRSARNTRQQVSDAFKTVRISGHQVTAASEMLTDNFEYFRLVSELRW
jgi:hypothetical protein